MKILYFSLVACLSFSASTLLAQNDKIETDRPSETQSTATTKKGFFQLETGVRKNQQRGTDYSLLYPETQLRYGISEHFEFRAQVVSESEKQFSKNEFHDGLQPVEIGFKAKITEGKGALPATTFYTQTGIPNWASKEHQKEHVFPKLRMLFENKLTDKIKLTYNAGAEWQGDESGPQWLYTFAPEFELGKKWEAFVETYAYLQKGQAPQHYVDGGLAFYPGKNIKLDLWGGKGISREAADYFLSAGVSFRMKP